MADGWLEHYQSTTQCFSAKLRGTGCFEAAIVNETLVKVHKGDWQPCRRACNEAAHAGCVATDEVVFRRGVRRCTLLAACPDGRERTVPCPIFTGYGGPPPGSSSVAPTHVNGRCGSVRPQAALVAMQEAPLESLPPCLRSEGAAARRVTAASRHPLVAVWAGDSLAVGSDAPAAFARQTDLDANVLFLVHSHRQQEAAFVAHAGVLMLSRDVELMQRAAILFVHNNGSTPVEALVRWLRGPYPMALRLLVHTSENAGFRCGEVHSLAGTAHVWGRFGWVIYASGPDNLMSPTAMRTIQASLVTGRCMLLDPFVSRQDLRKWSMDCFGFRSACVRLAGNRSIWDNASTWCRTTQAIPERILEDVATAANLSIQSLGLKKTALMPEPCDKLLQPCPNAQGWWHAHNVSLVEQWLRGGGAGHGQKAIPRERCKRVNKARSIDI